MPKQTVIEKAADSLTQVGQDIGQQLGMAAMATAAVISMVGHDEAGKKAIVPSQPVFAFAKDDLDSGANNPVRREKEMEDTGAHYVSYRVAQRTPARSGNH